MPDFTYTINAELCVLLKVIIQIQISIPLISHRHRLNNLPPWRAPFIQYADATSLSDAEVYKVSPVKLPWRLCVSMWAEEVVTLDSNMTHILNMNMYFCLDIAKHPLFKLMHEDMWAFLFRLINLLSHCLSPSALSRGYK